MCYSVFYMFVHFYPPIFPIRNWNFSFPFPLFICFDIWNWSSVIRNLTIHQGRKNTLPILRSFESSLISWENIFFCLGSFEITRLHFSLLYWRSNIVAMLKRLFKDTCLLLLLLMMIFATIRCPEFISQIEEVMCPLQCWSWVLSPSRPRPNCLELTSYITRLNSHLFLSVDNE
jgi:hypothetical protein